MADESMINKKEKVLSLFKYIMELNKLRTKTFLNVKDYPWHFSFSNIPEDTGYIVINYRDRVEEEEEETPNPVLLSVQNPEFDACPAPNKSFASWLEKGWENFRNEPETVNRKIFNRLNVEIIGKSFEDLNELLAKEDEVSEEILEKYKVVDFDDDEDRVKAFNLWKVERDNWKEIQIQKNEIRKFFMALYQQYVDLQRDSETLEIIVANGFIKDRHNDNIDQAVLTRRAALKYDPQQNVITLEDTDVDSDLYSNLLQEMDDINLDKLGMLREKLIKNDYHPLDRNDTPDFLKEMVRYFSGENLFSDNGIPEGWEREHRLLMYLDPTIIVRRRPDGTLRAIERIITNVEEEGFVPDPIAKIVSGGVEELPEDLPDPTIDEQLAAVGGESVDVLLSKEANKEQLDIAKRIENYSAVLVQGPPGTGKTHTIANLLGHFLAQGKSVLVTSHTKKALSVLKDKVAPELQSLCVSVLDDSNIDMERSVDGITQYMARYNSIQLKEMMSREALVRKRVIDDLAETRKKLFNLINQEANTITYNGEAVSPSAAASFVLENEGILDYIPGNVHIGSALPLSFDELIDLYRSNEGITESEEKELDCNLPNPETLVAPADYKQHCDAIENAYERLKSLSDENGIEFGYSEENNTLNVRLNNRGIKARVEDKESIAELKKYLSDFSGIEDWMIAAAVDGRKGGSYKQRWQLLVERIKETCEFAESVVGGTFGHTLSYSDEFDYKNYQAEFVKLRDEGGKAGKLTRKLNKKRDEALRSISIDGHELENKEECNLVVQLIELNTLRNKCANYWRDLFEGLNVPGFLELDRKEPEQVAVKWVYPIKRYLDWYENEYAKLVELLDNAGIKEEDVFPTSKLQTDAEFTEMVLHIVNDTIPSICDALSTASDIKESCSAISALLAQLQQNRDGIVSETCKKLLDAVSSRDSLEYENAYVRLKKLYSKYELQAKRESLLNNLQSVAPTWAEAIRSREGIHGGYVVPETILDAWKWKQYSGMIAQIAAEPFEKLQEDSLKLSKAYREATARYAEYSAWYHLISRTEADITMKQALQGWKQTVKAIGKGTGKKAPALKAEARKLMSKCQLAVPAWIMPINRALESLDPSKNRFDVIIIDEASQSDIASLAILYMGKKLIIVGDDQQVSPMAIGELADKIQTLQSEYIKDKIPNAHLYDGRRSIYDVAMTTFQPLMLKEHFRCVPEIIGYSNWLSYNFNIKPMRDPGSSNIQPAVVNYRVNDGRREGKINVQEGKTIISLIKACLEQPEYKGKTFGIISMLGNEQVKSIQSMIFKYIDAKEIEERKLICGISANFQGDERDIIFLSLVDSNEGEGPMSMMGFGPGDAYRKRYNVAASRAKDQLWIVDSIDPANDLKSGDIRKGLIDYSLNPNLYEVEAEKIKQQSESPFEEGVANALALRGYHIEQQIPVGAYRLDIVVFCGKKKVVIECDGEKWHSGEEKIREDMERQTILERIGWRFIRIRGSEYFRNPEKTIERVIKELNDLGIEPEEAEAIIAEERTSDLLERVKTRASQILEDMQDTYDNPLDLDTISFALNKTRPAAEQPKRPPVRRVFPVPVDVLKPEPPVITDVTPPAPEIIHTSVIYQQDSGKDENATQLLNQLRMAYNVTPSTEELPSSQQAPTSAVDSQKQKLQALLNNAKGE